MSNKVNKKFLEDLFSKAPQTTLGIKKILKLDREKLQRPIYFNNELYIAKDNSIIKIN